MFTKSTLSRMNATALRNLHNFWSWRSHGCDRMRLSTSTIPCLCKRIPDAMDKLVQKQKNNVDDLSVSVGGYKPFRDQDAPIIFDIEEERIIKQEQMDQQEIVDEFDGLLRERGDRGVFTPEELVNILHSQKAKDIVVVSIPSSYNYVDEMVIVTGKSYKHIYAISEFVHRAFKRKCSGRDKIPRIEGTKTSSWIALDLGNIALHVFSYDARKVYDIEMLWAVGPKFDTIMNLPEESGAMALKRHTILLDDLQPAVVNMKSE